jgi:site-specific DNA-methyltransferase (adenine-specific)
VLKPGGHALVWSIPRTSHWTATALEEAGFEVRDGITHFKDRSLEVQKFLATLTPEQRELLERAAPTDNVLGHCFGQGFPKSLNISKTLDKIARGAPQGGPDPLKSGKGEIPDRTTLKMGGGTGKAVTGLTSEYDSTYTPATPEAAQWEGWGTSLKPAVEIWWLVRKPLREKTVAEQVLKTGTGGINVDGSRVSTQEKLTIHTRTDSGQRDQRDTYSGGDFKSIPARYETSGQAIGRWPANVVLSHSPECKKLGTKKIPNVGGSTSGENAFGQDSGWNAHNNRPTEIKRNRDESGQETIEDWECAPGCPVGALNEQSGTSRSAVRIGGEGEPLDPDQNWRFKRAEGGYSDTGGASRFFHNFEPEYDVPFFYTGKITSGERKQDLEEEGLINKHPTVKSVKLMTFLVKLITPPGGTVLDPFAGSGSTLVAAVNNGFRFIGIERDPEYIKIAKGRLDKAVEREVLDQDQQDVFDELMNS